MSTTTTACPHQESAPRLCPGCKLDDPTWQDSESPTGTLRLSHCDGEVSGRVYSDSEGDAGVIGGIHDFLAVEDEEANCGCSLTDSEWDTVRARLAEIATDDWAAGPDDY